MSAIEYALWTEDSNLARVAVAAGVQHIGPDLEVTGKIARQAGTSSLLSGHSADSLASLRQVVPAGSLFVRTNPPSATLLAEIDGFCDQGVSCMMVPMIRSLPDAKALTEYVGNRAKIVLMIEHVDILAQVESLARLPNLHALYIGVNDLAISMNYASRFGPIADGWLDTLAAPLNAAGVRFGFLGAADVQPERPLPVPPDLAIAEMVRLGARWVVFARSFNATPETFAERFARLEQRWTYWRSRPPSTLETAHQQFIAACSLAESEARATFDRRSRTEKGQV